MAKTATAEPLGPDLKNFRDLIPDIYLSPV